MNHSAFAQSASIWPDAVCPANEPPSFTHDAVPALFTGSAGPLLQTVLDHVHFGVAVLGPELRLLFVNQAARRESARHPLLRIERGQLVVLQTQHQAELARAVAGAREGRWSLVQLGEGDAQTMLAVLPLSRHGRGDDEPVLMMFGARSPCNGLAIEFYARSCGLSPVETQVLRGLGDGLSPQEIAERHEVALSTVRSQVGSIRDRTGAHSITDLVRTLGCLPPIMPAALSAV